MDNNDKKSPQRVRSVSYPSFTLLESVELVKKINQQFGNSNHNTREDIAQELDMSVGNLIMKISTATQYGLLEMKSKEGYKPSNLFTSLYKPLSEEEKRKTEIECVSSPELYKKLLEHYKGKQLPAIGGLAILLYRSFKVAEDASTRAAKVFLENLSDLDLVDEDNRLKDQFFEEESGGQEITEVQIIENPGSKEQVQRRIGSASSFINIDNLDAPPIPIFLKGENRVAKVLMPKDFNNDDIDQVIKVLGVHKRPE